MGGENHTVVTVKWSVIFGVAALVISVLGSAIFVGRMFDRLEQIEVIVSNFTVTSSRDRGELHAEINNIRERLVSLEGKQDDVIRNETRLEAIQRTLDEVRGRQIDALARLGNVERILTVPIPPATLGPH